MWLIFRSTRDKKKFVIEVTGEETWNEIKNLLSAQYGLNQDLTINRETPIMDMDRQLKNDKVSDMDSFDLSIPNLDQPAPGKPTPVMSTTSYTKPKAQNTTFRATPSNLAAQASHPPIDVDNSLPRGPIIIEGDPPNFNNLVGELMQLGFSQEQSAAALRSSSYDVTAAANALYDGLSFAQTPKEHLTASATEYRNSMQSQYNALSEKDKAAVDRLKSRGFSLSMATEAYIAMEKNEANALALLNSY